MQAIARTSLFFLGAILLIFGLHDLAGQLRCGEELEWRFPLIFIGFGSGIPLVLFSFPGLFEPSDHGWGGSGDDYSGGGDSGGSGD